MTTYVTEEQALRTFTETTAIRLLRTTVVQDVWYLPEKSPSVAIEAVIPDQKGGAMEWVVSFAYGSSALVAVFSAAEMLQTFAPESSP